METKLKEQLQSIKDKYLGKLVMMENTKHSGKVEKVFTYGNDNCGYEIYLTIGKGISIPLSKTKLTTEAEIDAPYRNKAFDSLYKPIADTELQFRIQNIHKVLSEKTIGLIEPYKTSLDAWLADEYTLATIARHLGMQKNELKAVFVKYLRALMTKLDRSGFTNWKSIYY